MALNTDAMSATIQSKLQATGLFASAVHHEPKSAPALGSSVTAAFWFDTVRPAKSSGLGVISVVVGYTLRLYASALAEPADGIDPDLIRTADKVMEFFCTDFDIGGSARYLDVLGSDSAGVVLTPGYVTQDQKIFRTIDISLPIIVNDAWVVTP